MAGARVTPLGTASAAPDGVLGRAGHRLRLDEPGRAERLGLQPTRALDHAQSLGHERFGGLTGLRFNIGRVEGGIKANVIAPSAEVRFGFRPLPQEVAAAGDPTAPPSPPADLPWLQPYPDRLLEAIDEALRRPGRFDRGVLIPI